MCRGLGAYRVDLEIPGLTRLLDVDNDLFVVKACLLQGDMGSVCEGASVVGVEDDLRRSHFVVVQLLCSMDI